METITIIVDDHIIEYKTATKGEETRYFCSVEKYNFYFGAKDIDSMIKKFKAFLIMLEKFYIDFPQYK